MGRNPQTIGGLLAILFVILGLFLADTMLYFAVSANKNQTIFAFTNSLISEWTIWLFIVVPSLCFGWYFGKKAGLMISQFPIKYELTGIETALKIVLFTALLGTTLAVIYSADSASLYTVQDFLLLPFSILLIIVIVMFFAIFPVLCFGYIYGFCLYKLLNHRK